MTELMEPKTLKDFKIYKKPNPRFVEIEELKQELINDIKLYRKGVIGFPETIREYIKWKFNMTVFAAPYEPDGMCSIQLRAGADTPAAQHTVIIPERIAGLFDTTAQGEVLDGARVGSLGE